MNDLWDSVLHLMASDYPVLYATFLRGASPEPLEKAGVMVPHSPRDLADCPECGDACGIEILQDDEGNDEMYCVCMEHGWGTVDPQKLRRWSLHREPIINRFVEIMGIKGAMTPLIPDIVWKLGRQNRREYIFVRCCREEHIKMMTAELTKHPNSIFVTITPRAITRLDITLPNRAFSLVETTRYSPDGLMTVDLEKIEAILKPQDQPTKNSVPRRAVRTAKIELLVAELKEHYRISKDHYFTAGSLLRRPSQADLAKRTGLRQDDISRCLNDPSAIILQHLWNNAEELRVVLNS